MLGRMSQESVGTLVRRWRKRRRLSQLDISGETGVSTRHLSFVETGRAAPSRTMIARLCEALDVPLRERNALYLAAGFAPVHDERPLADLGAARAAVRAVLRGHEPYPSAAVNHRWELLTANRAMSRFLAAVPEDFRQPRINMLRVTLHPEALGPQIRNYEQWRSHTVRRIRRQRDRTGDPALDDLLREVEGYPVPAGARGSASQSYGDLMVPMVVDTEVGTLSLCYVLSVFGAPRDVTLDEIAIETSFPADEPTRAALVAMAEQAAADVAG